MTAGCDQLKSRLAKFGGHCPSEGGDKAFFSISHDQMINQWTSWLGGWDTLILNHKGYSKSNRTQQQKYICITNWGKPLLQIGAALFHHKLGQKIITNWGSLIITN